MAPLLSPSLHEFGISSRNGFLPDQLPLERLSNVYYQPWERIIAEFPALVMSRQLRSQIDSLPTLLISLLSSELEQQRAYSILSFMSHGYIWGGSIASEILPACIAVPFLQIADIFGLPTTATYAGLNLWNYAPVSPGISLCNPDNLRSLCTFSGTKDEEWFYLISVAMEARGGPIVSSMMNALEGVRTNDTAAVTRVLLDLAITLQDLAILLDRMYEHCDPLVFYYRIRPFLAGSKNMEAAGLPRGVFYDEGEGRGQWRMYSGGSNAQSSLIQLFDVVLGVEHKATGSPKAAGNTKHNGFIKVYSLIPHHLIHVTDKYQEMRRYMPERHAKFLAYLATLGSLRQYVLSNPADSALGEAFNSAVARLGEFRDRHIQIVTRYVIIPSRSKPNTDELKATKNLATASLKAEKNNGSGSLDGPEMLHGTGGTQLMPFLRQTRDETKDALTVMP